MTVAELRTVIEKGRLSEDIREQKWFNMGINYALNMLDVYIDYMEPETGKERERIMNHVDIV